VRWLHILLVALFVVGTFVFVIENFEIVTLSFLGFSARTRRHFLLVGHGDWGQSFCPAAPLDRGIRIQYDHQIIVAAPWHFAFADQ
jgi:hypothetical protein